MERTVDTFPRHGCPCGIRGSPPDSTWSLVAFKERSAVSELNLTGTAWTSEVRLGIARDETGDPEMEWRWKLR